jgi:hypothetical protein
MAYTAEKPPLARATETLRQEIVGWGVDLDPRNRPAVPKEQFNLDNGAHWTFPERQVVHYEREKSTEHKFLTPVFGTSCPPRGISGAIRRYAYRYSEGQSAHWLLLIVADRVDVLESNLGALLRGKPDNLLAERGLGAELKYHGIKSRFGRQRADLKHQPIDILLSVGTGLVLAGAVFAVARKVMKPARLF